MRRQTAAFPISAVKAIDGEAGTFEAIVSVFGNVDFQGDRIIEGAFEKSLERWRASGDPIPVIWSHQWHDLDAHIGEVDPNDARELKAGDPELPEEIRELGGLMVKAKLDTEDPAAAKALKLLKRRAVREFSFAYDVIDERRSDDERGVNDLLEVDVIEVGPTLKGANPLTQLVGAKAFEEAFARVVETINTDSDTVATFLKALEEELEEELEEDDAKAGEDLEEELEEEELEELDLEDGKTLSALAGILDRLDFALGKVGLEVIVKAGARNSGADLKRIQGIHDLTRDLGAKCADGDGSSSDDDEDGKGAAGGEYLSPAVIASTLELELTELT